MVPPIPLALVTSSTVALLSWIGIWPLESLLDRFKPETGGRWPEA